MAAAQQETPRLTRRERREALQAARDAGLNRRDRKALDAALRRGDASALAARASGDYSSFRTTSVGVVGEEAARANRSGRLSPTGSMREVGATAAGQTGSVKFDLGSLGLQAGESLLYDQASGKLYASANWNDIKHNAGSWVNLEGERFAGYVGQSSHSKKDDTKYSLSANIRPFRVAAFGDAPEKGTEEYQKWLEDEFAAGARQQAAANRLDPEAGGGQTGFGSFGSITVADWVELGRPKRVGGDEVLFNSLGTTLEELEAMSDSELLSRAGGEAFMTVDTKDRSHGVSRVLNKVGGWWGDSNFGDELMRVVTDFGKIPVIGSGVGMLANAVNSYEAARDAGGGVGSGLHEVGKSVLVSAASSVVDAVALAATVLTVVTLIPSGGTSAVVGGAAIGAMYGALASMVKSGVASATYGGFSESDLWNNMGEGAAYGAVSGAFAGAGVSGSSQTSVSVSGSGVAQGAAQAATRYALDYSAGGERRDNADEGLLYSAAGIAASRAFGGDAGAKDYPSYVNDQATVSALANGNYFLAFREQYAAQRGPQAWLVSRGTSNQAAYVAKAKADAEKKKSNARPRKTWNFFGGQSAAQEVS